MNPSTCAMRLLLQRQKINRLEEQLRAMEKRAFKFAEFKPGTIVRHRCPKTTRTRFYHINRIYSVIPRAKPYRLEFRYNIEACTKDGRVRAWPQVETVDFFDHCEVVKP